MAMHPVPTPLLGKATAMAASASRMLMSVWIERRRPVKQSGPMVVQLQAAGAIMVGKASTHEIGIGTTGLNVAAGALARACCSSSQAFVQLESGRPSICGPSSVSTRNSSETPPLTCICAGRHTTEPPQPGAPHWWLILRVGCADRRWHLPFRHWCVSATTWTLYPGVVVPQDTRQCVLDEAKLV